MCICKPSKLQSIFCRNTLERVGLSPKSRIARRVEITGRIDMKATIRTLNGVFPENFAVPFHVRVASIQATSSRRGRSLMLPLDSLVDVTIDILQERECQLTVKHDALVRRAFISARVLWTCK
jgi:hypothetical protein